MTGAARDMHSQTKQMLIGRYLDEQTAVIETSAQTSDRRTEKGGEAEATLTIYTAG